MPSRVFLETCPLYKEFDFNVERTLDRLPKPTINMKCLGCGENQTFEMRNNYYENAPYANYTSENAVVRCEYACSGCRRFLRTFFIYLSEDLNSLTKIGQYPPWEIKGNKEIENLLGDHDYYLRRGMISESQGYGIGAFAYYRRIVEEIIDELLRGIGDLLTEEEKERYAAALTEVGKTRIAAEKISLVKDLLPPILRPQGMNPLRTLHEVLSDGLHAKSENDCMQLAEAARQTLIFLATQLSISRNATAAFTTNMRKLLDKKS